MKFPQTLLIVQNSEDYKQMASLVEPSRLHLIRGAGVDPSLFQPAEEDPVPPTQIIMVCRLLWSKGVEEFVQALKILKEQNLLIQGLLVGMPDMANPDHIPLSTLRNWHDQGWISWLGQREDIAHLYQKAHIAVLPSYYREGVPKTLLEAASCGKPIVTTDWPGCRDVVEDRKNGFLVPIKDPLSLAEALKFLVTHPEVRLKMGQNSRIKTLGEFTIKSVTAQTLALYES